MAAPVTDSPSVPTTDCKLTDAELVTLESQRFGSGFLALWDLLLARAGMPPLRETAQTRSIRPGSFRIPLTQCQRLLDAWSARAEAGERGSILMWWMNAGPGTIDAAEFSESEPWRNAAGPAVGGESAAGGTHVPLV